jgi:hypothetical protein
VELEEEEMEDEGLEDSMMILLQDDNEQVQLLDEWVYDLQHKKLDEEGMTSSAVL